MQGQGPNNDWIQARLDKDSRGGTETSQEVKARGQCY